MNKFTRSQMGKIMAYALSAAMAVTVVPTYMMKPLVAEAAVANAENNLGLDKENLYVKEAYINEGRTMKRGRAGAKGRPDPIKKRTSHITVVVSESK